MTQFIINTNLTSLFYDYSYLKRQSINLSADTTTRVMFSNSILNVLLLDFTGCSVDGFRDRW